MQGYNCIMVYSVDGTELLFCKRTKEPYLGLYNLVGGKIEKDEDGFTAAYRELWEETGISSVQIQLYRMMDFTYYNTNCYLEVYAGKLTEEALLCEEEQPLEWLSVEENFFDDSQFAGEGNIGHMVEQVKLFGMGQEQYARSRATMNDINKDSTCIGVDGCKGGWIAAILHLGKLRIDRFSDIADIIREYPVFDELLIDMVIGLPSNKQQLRPDTYARQIIRERASTIFPAPCRQAVYATTVSDAYKENERMLGKKFTPLTVGILPKMRELDSFLQNNPNYKNVIKESHPEVCFSRLNGSTLLSRKSEKEGIEERIHLLSGYIPELSLEKMFTLAKSMKCNPDDIIDAVCLAVSANIVAQGGFEIIPDNPMRDDTELFMQMVIPCIS